MEHFDNKKAQKFERGERGGDDLLLIPLFRCSMFWTPERLAPPAWTALDAFIDLAHHRAIARYREI